jgi:hypothetical protein
VLSSQLNSDAIGSARRKAALAEIRSVLADGDEPVPQVLADLVRLGHLPLRGLGVGGERVVHELRWGASKAGTTGLLRARTCQDSSKVTVVLGSVLFFHGLCLLEHTCTGMDVVFGFVLKC